MAKCSKLDCAKSEGLLSKQMVEIELTNCVKVTRGSKLIGGLKSKDFIINGDYTIGKEIATGIYELVKLN